MRHPSILSHIEVVSQFRKLNLFVLEILSQILNFLLSQIPIVIILCLSIVLLLRQLQELLVVSGEARLDLIDLFPNTFIFYFNFEKVLHCVVSIELVSHGLLLKPSLWSAHLNLSLKSLKCFEHWSHIKLLLKLEGHWIVNLFKFSVKS